MSRIEQPERENNDKRWSLIRTVNAFQGFFKLNTYTFTHSLYGGGTSEPVEREVLERGHAAAVLPYDAATDSVLLIEQFRAGALENPAGPWLLEFVAGIVEPDENGEDVVRREAVEEAGIELDDVHYLTTFYPTPGGCSETIAAYWASADLTGAGGVFGLESEGEDIFAKVYTFDQAIEMMESGLINNAATIILLLWFQRIRCERFGQD